MPALPPLKTSALLREKKNFESRVKGIYLVRQDADLQNEIHKTAYKRRRVESVTGKVLTAGRVSTTCKKISHVCENTSV